MNFLAHLWLAERSATSLPGAILGDIVHGRDLSAYPDDIVTGIRLHRRIDVLTDSHPGIVALRSGYPQGARRYAGILLDLVCDHALILDWERYADEPLADFCRRSAQQVAEGAEWFQLAGARRPQAESFSQLLLSYGEPQGIDQAIRRTAQRLSRPQALLEAGSGWREVLPALRETLPSLLQDLCQAQI
ncbi:ACP phosphodiesterase [Solimonas sp. SE-A11]|uniref:acyl carrier protein phosphodiesterase n=1 Tax=Solimonas sp. SE-A11 TaxID=3054954 RepID=UPI00259C8853|nr:ACP phosphodiesterase [Solimonas sp. SE-A11]MDM4769663.1 ACP phosphodiesterase [Solimonas sp. SE-A11]